MKRDSARRGKRAVPAKGATGRTDFARLDATTDEDIARQIAEDPDTAPEFTDAMMENAEWVMPAKKVPISFRVDPDVLTHFQEKGPGYQSRMNAVLRSYMVHEQTQARAQPQTARRSSPENGRAPRDARASSRHERKR
jgi:uncharacterized protein (DUF4415 family)